MIWMVFVGGGYMDVHSYQNSHETKLLKSVHFIICKFIPQFKILKNFITFFKLDAYMFSSAVQEMLR